MKVLLVTPPFTQVNTPYPATAYLKGFLNTKNISSQQVDLGLETILELFSKKGLQDMFQAAFAEGKIESDNALRIYSLREYYISIIDDLIAFLQGKNSSMATLICSEYYLPQASRFDLIDDLDYTFGEMGIQQKAKHLATLCLEDLMDFIVESLDPEFGFNRYAEKIGLSATSFDDLEHKLNSKAGFIDRIYQSLLQEKITKHQPQIICFSVPFPGNLFSALRCGQWLKNTHPQIKTIMGGGFVNTELRSLKETRVFQYFDYITLDDGELPLELLINHIASAKATNEKTGLKRTYYLQNDRVCFNNSSGKADYKQAEIGTPDYSDLPIDKYISLIEITNPMHSLWSDGKWMKLTMAHGCYWGKCTFCDTCLPYIKNYEANPAKIVVDRMESIISQTGERGFHFVDEAAPPKLMRDIAIEILSRKLNVSWWANVRFEKAFTAELCKLLKASGCIAVSGGLEVASDRLLKLINKGVSVEQVAQVCLNFTMAGIMVHAYLMYGFPSQTVQETIDSLEVVRQMFELKLLKSGFWHQFALTAHSLVGQEPTKYGITPIDLKPTFAHNDIPFTDKTGINHSEFSEGLKKSIFNFMNDVGFDVPLQGWFDFTIPKPTVPKQNIENCLSQIEYGMAKDSARLIWLGPEPLMAGFSKGKKEYISLLFHDKTESIEMTLEEKEAYWFSDILKQASVLSHSSITVGELKERYLIEFGDFNNFWYSESLVELRADLLLAI